MYEDYINLSTDEWDSLCKHAFQKPHDFLLMDMGTQKFYRNLAEIVKTTDS